MNGVSTEPEEDPRITRTRRRAHATVLQQLANHGYGAPCAWNASPRPPASTAVSSGPTLAGAHLRCWLEEIPPAVSFESSFPRLLEDDAALPHEIRPICDLESRFHILLDHQNGQALISG